MIISTKTDWLKRWTWFKRKQNFLVDRLPFVLNNTTTITNVNFHIINSAFLFPYYATKFPTDLIF